MKRFIQYGSLWLLLCLAACTKEKNDSLPPETQTGAGTFGCKINGKVWVPKGTNYYSGQNVSTKYSYVYPSPIGYTLIISAHDYEANRRSFFDIGMDSMKLSTGMVIDLTNRKGMGGAIYSVLDESQNYITYYVNDSLRGKMTISQLDEVNKIISGTFFFDAINRLGEKVHITEGRFDTKYTQ